MVLQTITNLFQSLTPDDQTFRALASLYATRHKSMFKGSGLCHDDNFPGGHFLIYTFDTGGNFQVESPMVPSGML